MVLRLSSQVRVLYRPPYMKIRIYFRLGMRSDFLFSSKIYPIDVLRWTDNEVYAVVINQA